MWLSILITTLLTGVTAQNVPTAAQQAKMAARQIENPECFQYFNMLQSMSGLTLSPSLNFSKPVQVTGAAEMQGIQSVMEVEGRLSIMVGLRMSWFDRRIQWFPDDCPIDSTYIFPANRFWLPWIWIENAHKDNVDTNLASQYLIQIFNTGQLVWNTGKKYEITCDFALDEFPRDNQVCELVIYLGGNMMLITNDTMDTSRTMISNELWNVTGTFIRSKQLGPGYTEWRMRIFMQRNVRYYLYSLIIPTLTLTPLSALPFMLPPDSGEKLSAALTTLLTYFVMALSFFESLPSSNTLPLLANIFLYEMIFSTFCAVVASIVLNMAEKEKMLLEKADAREKMEKDDLPELPVVSSGVKGKLSLMWSKLTAERVNTFFFWFTALAGFLIPSLIIIISMGNPLPPLRPQ